MPRSERRRRRNHTAPRLSRAGRQSPQCPGHTPGRPAPPPAEPDPASLQACVVTPAHRRSGLPPPPPRAERIQWARAPLTFGSGPARRSSTGWRTPPCGAHTRLRLVPGPRGTAGVQAKWTHVTQAAAPAWRQNRTLVRREQGAIVACRRSCRPEPRRHPSRVFRARVNFHNARQGTCQ